MDELGGDEQHRGAVRARGDARAAADARGGVHRVIGVFLRDEESFASGAEPQFDGDESAGRDHAVEGRAIDAQILDHGERASRATARCQISSLFLNIRM